MLMLLFLGLNGCGSEPEPTKPAVPFAQEKNASVHFLDCGKADAILLLADGEACLIDAGYAERASEVVAYLQAQGVTTLKYLVATHGDKDHVGGLSAILDNFTVEQLLVSPKKEDSPEYLAMIAAANRKKVPVSVPAIGQELGLGAGTFRVLAPGEAALKEGSDNDASLVLSYRYGVRSFLLMGDALGTTEKEMREQGLTFVCDVLKVGHHGKSDASKKKFLKAVKPLYSVICCGSIVGDDEDGTPDEAVLANLQEIGSRVLRTDLLGTIVFDTDGKELSLREAE